MAASASRKRSAAVRDESATEPSRCNRADCQNPGVATGSPLQFLDQGPGPLDAASLRVLYGPHYYISRDAFPFFRGGCPIEFLPLRADPALERSGALFISHEQALVMNRGLYALLVTPPSSTDRAPVALCLQYCYRGLELGTAGVSPLSDKESRRILHLGWTAADFAEQGHLAVDGCTRHVWVWASSFDRHVRGPRDQVPIDWLVALLLHAGDPGLKEFCDAFRYALRSRARWNYALLGLLERAAGCGFLDLLPYVLQYSD